MKKKDPTSHRIIEKRRRDRMNNCLADLSKLIPAHYMKKGRGRIEKTEIIEMAIKHLKDLIEQQSSSNQNTNTNTNDRSNSTGDTLSRPPQSLPQQTEGQLEPKDVGHKSDANQTSSLSSSSSSSCSLLLSSSSLADEVDSKSQLNETSANSCSRAVPVRQISAQLVTPQSRLSTKNNLDLVPNSMEGKQNQHLVRNGFISNQDIEHLANVNNKTLINHPKREPKSPQTQSTANNSQHQHQYQHHHHNHHQATSSSTSTTTTTTTTVTTTTVPMVISYDKQPNMSSSSGALSCCSVMSECQNSGPSSSGKSYQNHHYHTTNGHHHLKYRSSPNSSGSDSGGSSSSLSSSYGSSGDNSAGSSGNMSGSSSGHRAGGSSCSIRTSCSSSSVTSMNAGNLTGGPVGLVVDRGTTTSLQAAMAAATVSVPVPVPQPMGEPVGGNTSSSGGSISSSLNSISSDSSTGNNGQLQPKPATGNRLVTDSNATECCTCGARILSSHNNITNNKRKNGITSDLNNANDLDVNTANIDLRSSDEQNDSYSSLDYSNKTSQTIGRAIQHATVSGKRVISNEGDGWSNYPASSSKQGSKRRSVSSTGSHSMQHQSSSTSSTSSSTPSPSHSSTSSVSWYKKAWLVRSFSRTPPPR